jgi:RNA polymerase sigma-70 factor (ECF subfamily)
METPASLLERLRQPGDADAWSRFVQLYTPLLYYWARRIGLQEADAADLVQEALALLFVKLPEFTYNPGRSFRGWLRTVLLNKWRESCRRYVMPTGDPHVLAELLAADDTVAFEEEEYRRHLVALALEALRPEFPLSTWSCFEQYVLQGQLAEAVAGRQGVRVGTVYAAKSRILARLRRELRGLLD